MLKQDVGIRFKSFRLDQKKAQHVMAAELNVHQSTITNIEHGTTFPKISYLYYFFEKYGLNINWLITGEGDMYLRGVKDEGTAEPVMLPHIGYGDPNYQQFLDLSKLIQVPVIEQVLLAKLTECKIFFKEEIKKYFDELKEKEAEALPEEED
jgi:transcriptional regulator with XRE-family HTH domain